MENVTPLIDGHLWELKIELFGAEIFLVYADEADDWHKYLKPIQKDSSDEWLKNLTDRVKDAAENTNAATVSNCKTIVILLKKSHLSLPILVHETVHAQQDILSACGIKDSNGEVEAYLTAFIFEKLSQIVKSLPTF